MKKKLFNILFLLVLTTGISFAQDGSYYDEELPIGQESFETNLDDFQQWCQDVTTLLQRTQKQALMAYTQGNFLGAMDIFHQGLIRSLSRYQRNWGQNIFTLRYLERAKHISDIVRTDHVRRERDVRTMVVFLDNMINFIIDNSIRYDRTHLGPYRCSQRRSCYRYIEDFESDLVNIAFQGVEFTLTHLFVSSGHMITPRGSSRLVLKIVEMVLSGALTDLTSILNPGEFACSTQELNDLVGELREFIRTGRLPHLPNIVHAYQYFYTETLLVARSNHYRCY